MKNSVIGIVVGLVIGYLFLGTNQTDENEATVMVDTMADVATSYAATPGTIGGQEYWGAYDVDPNWPIDIAEQIPGHEGWTWGAGQSVFAESPDRVFVLVRGEIPSFERPRGVNLMESAGIPANFPQSGFVPWRNTTNVSLPVGLEDTIENCPETSARGECGVDVRWEHSILIFNREGELTESWTQWDHLLRRPHAIYISPFDPEKHVWIVDDYRHAIFKFSNDGSELVQTIGEPNVGVRSVDPEDDLEHFYRPTFMVFRPDGGFYVSDGYLNTRVVRFNADGSPHSAFGQAGINGARENPPTPETRPGYMFNVHGLAMDYETGNVFVNDRNNNRVQVFTEDGEYVREWSVGALGKSNIHLFWMGEDRNLWAFDQNTQKMLKYSNDGEFLYQFGGMGGRGFGFFGVHGIHVDQEGNLYVAEVGNGGAQKFIPREGANPDMMLDRPVYSAWE
jgi:DNA-binding beta-propeller fold protein YncE